MAFDELTRYREEFNFMDVGDLLDSNLCEMYTVLMECPSQRGVELDTVRILPALDKLKAQKGLQSIRAGNMELYWAWVTMMFGPEVVERFGGLNIVDPGLLPMGMVNLLRERKVTWQE